MSYYDTINEAIDLVVVTDVYTGASYLEPRYRSVLDEANIHLPGNETPGDEKDQELYEILKLEVEKRNAKMDFARPMFEWLYATMTQVIDPAETQEENELMKNLLEYFKLKEEIKQKSEDVEALKQEVEQRQQELDNKEKSIDMKAAVTNDLPLGVSFAKRK